MANIVVARRMVVLPTKRCFVLSLVGQNLPIIVLANETSDGCVFTALISRCVIPGRSLLASCEAFHIVNAKASFGNNVPPQGLVPNPIFGRVGALVSFWVIRVVFAYRLF